MPRRLVLSPDAVRQLRAMRATERALLTEAMKTQLAAADATEAVALSQNKDFWHLYDEAARRGEQEGFTALEDLEQP